MIKFSSLIFSLLIFCASSFAQNYPSFYKLESTSKIITSENPLSNGITDILITGDTVWIGTSKGLSKTTDGGETWKNYFGTGVFGKEDISALGYNNNSFWAATVHVELIDGEYVQTGSGLRFSTNGGATWTYIPQPVDDPGDSLTVYGINDGITYPKVRALPITVPQLNIIWDMAFTGNTIWITSWSGGLRKSTDYGATWQRVLLPADSLNSLSPSDKVNFSLQPQKGDFGPEEYLNHVAFSVAAVDDSTIFVGTANGINKSTDGGVSWIKFNNTNQNNPISGNFVVALEYDEFSGQLWAATWRTYGTSEYYGVSVSDDLGANWRVFLQGEKAHNFAFGPEQAIVLSDNGAFISENSGTNFITVNKIADSESGLSLEPYVFYSAAISGNDIWVGTDNGLALLNKKGSGWQGDWKVFLASQKIKNLSDTYAFPVPFSPNLENLKIKYSLSEPSPVTIRIFDFGMNLIRTVIQNAERGGAINVVDSGIEGNEGIIDYWEGKDENGSVVPNGVYFYRIDIPSQEPAYGKIMVVR